ncbi:MAG TPA: M20 family metallopeptidase [Candidatus Limnocylindrales bacterium]
MTTEAAAALSDSEIATLVIDASSLIAIETPNPPGNELAAARWLDRRLRGSATRVEVVVHEGERASVSAAYSFGSGPVLILNTHLDVVPVTSPSQWSPQVRDGRLHGRGACDAKGALAAMIAACERLNRDPAGMTGTILLNAVADEEVGALGTQALLAGGLSATAAIVGEPTGNELLVGSRGAYRIAVSFTGVAAHSSAPADGVNAVYRAARFILAIEALNARLAGPDAGACAATVVHGGTKANVIPDSCTVQVDRRLATTESLKVAAEEIEAILRGQREEDPDLTWDIEAVGTQLEPVIISPASSLVARCLEALGHDYPGSTFPAGTDAPHLVAAGIPTVIYGPGSLAQAHAAEEWVEVGDLVAAAQGYEAIARALLR